MNTTSNKNKGRTHKTMELGTNATCKLCKMNVTSIQYFNTWQNIQEKIESVGKEITENLKYLEIDMSNIDLIVFLREEKQNKKASNEDGTTIIAEIVGGLSRLFQEFLKNIEYIKS